MSFSSGMQQNAPSANRSLQLKGKKDKKEPAKGRVADLAEDDRAENAITLGTMVVGSKLTIDGLQSAGSDMSTAMAMDSAGVTLTDGPEGKGMTSALEQTAKGVQGWTVVGGIFDVVSVVLSALTVKDKWTKWSAFDSTAGKLRKDPKKRGSDTHKSAVYASAKTERGFWSALTMFGVALAGLVASIITLIGAAAGGIGAALGLTLKLAIGIGKMFRNAWRTGKALWKAAIGKRGKHRRMTAAQLLDAATAGDEDAAELLLKLDLGLIVGSPLHAIKRSLVGQHDKPADGGSWKKRGEKKGRGHIGWKGAANARAGAVNAKRSAAKAMGLEEGAALKNEGVYETQEREEQAEKTGKKAKPVKQRFTVNSNPKDLIAALQMAKTAMESDDPTVADHAKATMSSLRQELMTAMRSVV